MPTDEQTPPRRVYAVAPAVALRGVGVGSAGLGICLVAALLLRAAPGVVAVPAGALLLLVAVFSGLVLTVGVARVTGHGPRLVLDDEGFTNTTGPGRGVRRVAWRDVRTVRTDGPVVVVDLAGGRRSVIRTGPLAVSASELNRELRARLNRGHGYRPL